MSRATDRFRPIRGTHRATGHADNATPRQAGRCDARRGKGHENCPTLPCFPCGFDRYGNKTVLCEALASFVDSLDPVIIFCTGTDQFIWPAGSKFSSVKKSALSSDKAEFSSFQNDCKLRLGRVVDSTNNLTSYRRSFSVQSCPNG